MSIGFLFTENYTGFELKRLAFEPIYSGYAVSTQVDFYHDMDLYTYTRSTYTLLDYLRDIGGLLGAFNGVFGALVFILNFNGLY